MDEDEYPAKKYLNDSKLLNVDKFQSSKKEDLQSIIENYIKEIMVDNIERIAKLANETISVKDKLIENLTKERDTVSEKYKKYNTGFHKK